MSFEQWKQDNEEQVPATTTGFEQWKQGNVAQGIAPPQESYSPEMLDLAYDYYTEDIAPLGKTPMDKQKFFDDGGAASWIRDGATRRIRNYKDDLVEAGKRGLQDFKTDQSYYDAKMMGNTMLQDYIFKQWKTNQAREQLDPIRPEANKLSKAALGTARLMPGMIEGTKQAAIPIMMGAGVAAAAGQMGPQVALPEEVVTIPAGIFLGWKLGSSTAWYRQGTGSMMLKMREMEVDSATTDLIAGIAGIPYALVEQMQLGHLIPGIRTAANKVIAKSMTKVIANAGARYGITLASETGEEVIQESIAIIAEDLAVLFEKHDIQVSKEELIERANRLWNTAKESVNSMALLPIPGAAIDIRTGYKGKQLVTKIEDAGYNPKQAVSMAKKIDSGIVPEQAHQLVVDETIADVHNETGGAVVSQQTGRTINKGFVVSLGIEEKVTGDTITAEQVRAFEEKNVEELSKPNRQVNVWRSEGITHIEVAHIAKTQAEAMELGNENKLQAVHNLETGETINLDEAVGPNQKVDPRNVSTTKIPDYMNTMVLAQEHGLSEADVQAKLDNAELRYRELQEQKELSPQDQREQRFLATYRKNPKALLTRDSGPVEDKVYTKKQVMDRVHNLADTLGYDIVKRRALQMRLTGKESLKGMVPAQREQIMMFLEREAKEQGVNIKGIDETPVGELQTKLRERKQVPSLRNRDRRRMTKLKTMIHDMKRGVSFYFLNSSRIRRVAKMLDNYEEDGPFSRYIFRPVREAVSKAIVNYTAVMESTVDAMNEMGIDAAAMITEVKDIGIDDQLSTAERIGVYALSKNEKTMNHLTSEFTEEEIAKIVLSVEANENELKVAAEIGGYFEHGWGEFEAIGNAVGLKGLVKEDNYITAFISDRNAVESTDFLDGLTEMMGEPSHVPGEERAIKRQPGAKRNLELDIFAIHARAARSIERFKAMAPVAAKVGSIMNHRGFKNSLNNATYGHGSKLFNTWLADAVRGGAAYDTSRLAPMLRWFRKSSMNYVLGYKLLTAGKQGLSAITGMSVDPKMVPLVWGNMMKVSSPKKFRAMYTEAIGKSNMLRTRDWERDLRTTYNKKTVQKMYAGKKLSPASMRMAAYIDKRTSLAVWYSAYQLSKSEEMSEIESVQFADGVLQDTQPMADAADLPAYFRGNEMEKTLTVFQNQVNQNGNFLWYDVLGEAKSKKINLKTAAYRLMMSQIVPAYILGSITRGRPSDDPAEILKDQASYLLSPFVFVGKLIYNVTTGEWGPAGNIASTPFTETGRLIRSVKKGEGKNTAKYAARTIGAWSGGKVPLQAVTSAEGAWDLATGESDDWRTLVWSKYALKGNSSKKSDDVKVKY